MNQTNPTSIKVPTSSHNIRPRLLRFRNTYRWRFMLHILSLAPLPSQVPFKGIGQIGKALMLHSLLYIEYIEQKLQHKVVTCPLRIRRRPPTYPRYIADHGGYRITGSITYAVPPGRSGIGGRDMSVVQRRFGYGLEVATPLVALAFSDTLVYYPLLTLVLPIRSRSRKLAPLGGLPASEYRRAQRRPLGNR
jgi:hypothetical protein